MSAKSKGRGGVGGPKLEDLMMSYADLNSNTSGIRGFKGPPVKDIKQAEVKTTTYTPSSKARDWKSLDQNLESAFSVMSPATPQSSMQLNPVGDIGQFFNSSSPNNAPVTNSKPQSLIDDDWGDFQGFTSPALTNISSGLNHNSLVINQSTPAQVNKTANNVFNWPTKPSIKPSNSLVKSPSPPQKQHFSDVSLSNSKTTNQNSYVSPSHSILYPVGPNFAGSTKTPSISEDTFNNCVVNNTSNSNDTLTHISSTAKESVGCRLASFQEESPVHRFKTPTGSKQSSAVTTPADVLEDDFGEFTSIFSAPSQPTNQSMSLPPIINVSTIQSSSFSSLTPTLRESGSVSRSGSVNGQDKYSALRDLFGSSSESPALEARSGLDVDVSSINHNSSSDNLINASSGNSFSRQSLSPLPGGDSSINSQLNTSFDRLMPGIAGPAAFTSPASCLTPSPNISMLSNTSADKLVNSSPFSASNPFVEAAYKSTNDFFIPATATLSPFSTKNDLKPIKDIASRLVTNLPMPNTSANDLDDDFGDFIEPVKVDGRGSSQNLDDYDEWSLPNTINSVEPIKPADHVPIKTFGITMSKPGSSSVPYFSSSPPLQSSTPPPMEPAGGGSQDLDFELPSEQLRLPDKVVFGINEKPKEERGKKSMTPSVPSSLTDILKQTMEQRAKSESQAVESNVVRPEIDIRLASVDLNNDSSSNTKLDEWSRNEDVFMCEDNVNQLSKSESPQSLRLPSPENGSVASLEFDTENRLSISGEFRKNSNGGQISYADVIESWLDVLVEIENLFRNACDSFRKIEETQVRQHVMSDERASAYIHNIREIYFVFRRIKHSAANRSLSNQNIIDQCDAIDKVWTQLLFEMKQEASILSLAEKRFNPGIDNATRICGICLCAAQLQLDLTCMANVNLIVWNGMEYHAACANFWVNCIASSLVSLAPVTGVP